MIFFTTFLIATIYNILNILWAHYTKHQLPGKLALVSSFSASCMVFGIGPSIRDYNIAPFFILGYGFGGFLGAHLTKKLSKT